MNTPPLRLVAIGCGRVFERYHLPAIRATSQVQLVGACEVDAARRAWASAELAASGKAPVPCVESLDELLRSVTADAALLATPAPMHSTVAEAVLKAGLHVLVEKPMSLTLDEARQLWVARRRADRVLRVAFNRRYRADYARLRQPAHRVEAVAFTFIADAQRWNAETPATPEYVLHDVGSHAVDLVAHVAGAPFDRVRVSVRTRETGCVLGIEAELRNGASATCRIGHLPRHEEHLAVTAGGRVDRAEASTRLLGRIKLGWCRLVGRPTPTDASFQLQLQAFASACGGRPDEIGADAAHGLASVAAVSACLRSLDHSGDWCDVPDTAEGTSHA